MEKNTRFSRIFLDFFLNFFSRMRDVHLRVQCRIMSSSCTQSKFLLMTFEFTLRDSSALFFGQIPKRRAFVAVRPETTIPAVKPKRLFLSFHVKLY